MSNVPDRRLLVQPIGQIAARPIAWLVEPFLPLPGLTLIAGDPGLGKTTAATSLALALAVGGLFLGRTVLRPVRVIYVAADEVAAEVKAGKFDPAAMGLGVDLDALGDRLCVCDEQLELDRLGDQKALADAVKAGAFDVVVLDPLAALLGAADGNDEARLRPVLRFLRGLVRQGCSVLVVHHTTKASDRPAQHRLRGSLALPAQADAAFVLTADSQGTGFVCAKMRSGAMPARIGVRFAWTSSPTAVRLELVDQPAGVVRTGNGHDLLGSIDLELAQMAAATGLEMDALGRVVVRPGAIARRVRERTGVAVDARTVASRLRERGAVALGKDRDGARYLVQREAIGSAEGSGDGDGDARSSW